MATLLICIFILIVITGICYSRGHSTIKTTLVTQTKLNGSSTKHLIQNKIQGIIQNNTIDLDVCWRFHEATERQYSRIREYLLEIDCPAPSSLTKGQASDIIGLFREPENEDLEMLKFFKINHIHKLNQTESRWKLHEIFLDPNNVALWENKPATTEQKELIHYLSEEQVTNISFDQASDLLDELIDENEEKHDEYELLYIYTILF
ncbi:MAG: hypothetical protein COB22_08130 [Cycloclasticus sp.]|nr:MAG: hypothetical protein COB22_08130 [Cycloclasticus sp.]